MEVVIKDLDSYKFRNLRWLEGNCLARGMKLCFADYGVDQDGTQRWLVYDPGPGPFGLHLYTTEEMQVRYRSIRDDRGKLIPAPEDWVELVSSLAIRKKLKDGCPGCDWPWGTPARADQCKKCKRCFQCCIDAEVKYSCKFKLLQRAR